MRSANNDAPAGSGEELRRIVAQIRSAWPEVRIVVRGVSGFCREELMSWCEGEGVDYLLGLAKNERLKAEIEKEMGEAKAQYQETGRAARLFKEFVYQHRPPLRGGYLSLKLLLSSTAGRCGVGSDAQRGPAAKAVLS